MYFYNYGVPVVRMLVELCILKQQSCTRDKMKIVYQALYPTKSFVDSNYALVKFFQYSHHSKVSRI